MTGTVDTLQARWCRAPDEEPECKCSSSGDGSRISLDGLKMATTKGRRYYEREMPSGSKTCGGGAEEGLWGDEDHGKWLGTGRSFSQDVSSVWDMGVMQNRWKSRILRDEFTL